MNPKKITKDTLKGNMIHQEEIKENHIKFSIKTKGDRETGGKERTNVLFRI